MKIPVDALKNFIETAMQHYHIPGVALGLIQGEQTLALGFGVTSLENPLPVDEHTLFQVGSVTKTFTALAVMRLVQQGRVDLDAPVRTYLPGLRLADEQVAQRVTLRHIFNHTPGWLGDYFDDTGPGDDALERMVERLAVLPQETPLGEVYSYNNAGFYVAGRLIEVLTGQTYERALHDLVLEPLGMQDGAFFDPAQVMTYRFAVGHDAVYPGEDRPPKVQRPWALARCGNPVGALTASVQAMLMYARFQLQGGDLLSPDLLAEMHTPRQPAANDESVGVAWFIRNELRPDGSVVRVIRHGGATNGQMATFQFVPQEQFAVVVLTNSDRGDELYKRLVDWLLEQALGVVVRHAVARPAQPGEMEALVGVYEAAANRLEVSIEDGGLKLQAIPRGGFPTQDSPPQPTPPPSHLGLTGPDRVIVLDEPGKGDQGEFLRDPDGTLRWLRMSGRVHRRLG